MLFNSEIFIFGFLPVTLLGFFLLGARGLHQLAIAWLVFASCVFYGWFKANYLLLLAVLIVFNYYFGIKLARDHRKGRQSPFFLFVGIMVNLGVLAYYKYTNFIIANSNALFGTHFVFHQIILPLGISFFTFQKIAYLVDAYRGEAEEYNFLDFSLFVMYFPQLIAGPIVHHKEMIPQFRQASIFKLCPTDLAAGLTLFTIGLLKKIMIADRVVTWSDPIFAAAHAGSAPHFLDAWAAALSFSFQIYFDFSGYTDMALGLALMIGIRLPLNFNSPYKAASIIDFWHRWHMSLSRFLRDYLYFPLGGNRRGPVRRYVNLMLTMLIGGLWHGANWTFVAWGGLHGFYLIVNHGWNAIRERLGLARSNSRLGCWSARLITFVAVVAAWVFFRAESFHGAMLILEGMVGLNGVLLPSAYANHLGALASLLEGLGIHFDAQMAAGGLGARQAAWLALLLVGVWELPNSQELLANFRPALEVPPVPAHFFGGPFRRAATVIGLLHSDGTFALTSMTGLLVAAAMLGALLQQSSRAVLQQFIYFQF